MSVTIDRTSLSLSDLVISSDGSGTFTLTPDGLGAMGVTWRRKYVTSTFLHGGVLASAVRENSTLPLQVYIQATSTGTRTAAIDELAAALAQFDYEVTTAHDSKTWRASPADWSVAGSHILHANVRQFLEVVNIVIPVYPVPVA